MVYHGLFTSALSGGDIEFMVWSDSEERFQLLASRLRQQLRPNRWRCLEMPVVLAEFFWKGKHRHSSSAYWLEFLGKNTFFVQVELFVRIGECIVCGFPMFSLLLPWGMQGHNCGRLSVTPSSAHYAQLLLLAAYYVLATDNCIQLKMQLQELEDLEYRYNYDRQRASVHQ